jgi:glutathione synthase/RimK-type ligase-like ATP-grasp enzyme
MGADGVADGRHDVRLYIIDSKLVLMSVRRPKAGEFLANTSQGGSIEFFSARRIPLELGQTAEQIIDKITPKVYNYFISLDFFYDGSKWLLIEVNDQPGVPAEYQTPEAKTIYKLFAQSVQGA